MAWARSGFTTRASCLIAAGATALACGLLLGIVDLARAGVLALAVPLLSALVVQRSQVLIANRRAVEPARAVAGDTVVVHLTISNRSLLPTGTLMLEDQLPGQLHGNARFALDGLLTRETRTVSYRMPRLPRGRYRAGPLHIRLTDPFHLVDVRRSFTGTSEIIITPVIEKIRGAEPPRSMDVGDDAGSHSVGARGAADASTREYRTGDDLRKIHWRSSARTGSLMVRQDEQPWRSELTVLLDCRAAGHVEGPHSPAAENDERLRSSFEWAVSAAATIATHSVVSGREVGLVDDPDRPARVPVLDAAQIGEHLATVRTVNRTTLAPLGGLLAASARETTLIAVLGDLDPTSLRLLAGVHPRGASNPALAVLLDTASWARGPGARPGQTGGRAKDAARILRAAGWQVAVVGCGESVGAALERLLSSRGSSGFSGFPGLAGVR
jgi:uncharacterized protein (DUF58 family)